MTEGKKEKRVVVPETDEEWEEWEKETDIWIQRTNRLGTIYSKIEDLEKEYDQIQKKIEVIDDEFEQLSKSLE